MQGVLVTRKRGDWWGWTEKRMCGERRERGFQVGQGRVRRVMGVAYERLRQGESQSVWTIGVIQDGRVERNNQLRRKIKKNTIISETEK